MALRISILNNTEELLSYPLEQFTSDLAERVSKYSLMFKTEKSRIAAMRAAADQLIIEFKRKTISLPAGVEGK